MRHFSILGLVLLLLGSSTLHAQVEVVFDESTPDSTIRAALLKELTREQKRRNDSLTNMMSKLNEEIQRLDKEIKSEGNAEEKVEKLLQRISTLENLQSTVAQKEVVNYQSNYEKSILAFYSIDQLLGALDLFLSTRKFASTLQNISNPMSYPGFQNWFKEFQDFSKSEASNSPILGVLNTLMQSSGQFKNMLPVAGPLANVLFDGFSLYLNSKNLSGRRNEDKRKEAQKMMELVALLGQFDHSQQVIEAEWRSIGDETEQLLKEFDDLLPRVLDTINISKSVFVKELRTASGFFEFMDSKISPNIEKAVEKARNNGGQNWKARFYTNMQLAQSLYLRSAQLSFRAYQNLGEYQKIIDQFKATPMLQERVAELQKSLDEVQEKFNKHINFQDHIQTATSLYNVY